MAKERQSNRAGSRVSASQPRRRLWADFHTHLYPQVDSLDTADSWRQPDSKFEFSKSETRNKFKRPKIQNPRRQFLGVWEIHRRFLGFEFGICFGFRISEPDRRCPARSS